jgi:hypothetical protein
MKNYFRITAYNSAEDISVIMDSNGVFEKIWQFSSLLVQKGFKILEVGNEEKFLDGNFDRAPEDKQKIILRACSKGQPIYNGNTVQVSGRYYIP